MNAYWNYIMIFYDLNGQVSIPIERLRWLLAYWVKVVDEHNIFFQISSMYIILIMLNICVSQKKARFASLKFDLIHLYGVKILNISFSETHKQGNKNYMQFLYFILLNSCCYFLEVIFTKLLIFKLLVKMQWFCKGR